MPVSMKGFFSPGGMGEGGNPLLNRPAGSGAVPQNIIGNDTPLSAETGAEDAVVASGVEMPVHDIGPKDSTKVSEIATGAALGASIGSVFPVIGTGVGAVVGTLFGALGGMDLLGMGGPSKGEIMRDRRKATQRSYAAGQGAYDYATAKRTEIDDIYEAGLASGRAKLAGQGVEVDGSSQWAQLQGGLSKTRNESIASLEKEMSDFRKGDHMEWFRNDYGYLTGVKQMETGSLKNMEERNFSQTIGQDDHGRSNAMVYDKDQYKQLRTNTNKDLKKTFEEYSQRLAPGVEAYEKAQFGTAEDKAQYKADVDARIVEANKWYDREVQTYRAKKYNAGLVYNPRNDDRGTGSNFVKQSDGTFITKAAAEAAKSPAQRRKEQQQNERGK